MVDTERTEMYTTALSENLLVLSPRAETSSCDVKWTRGMHSSMQMQRGSCPLLSAFSGGGDLEKLCKIGAVLLGLGRVVAERMRHTCFLPRKGLPSLY